MIQMHMHSGNKQIKQQWQDEKRKDVFPSINYGKWVSMRLHTEHERGLSPPSPRGTGDSSSPFLWEARSNIHPKSLLFYWKLANSVQNPRPSPTTTTTTTTPSRQPISRLTSGPHAGRRSVRPKMQTMQLVSAFSLINPGHSPCARARAKNGGKKRTHVIMKRVCKMRLTSTMLRHPARTAEINGTDDCRASDRTELEVSGGSNERSARTMPGRRNTHNATWQFVI